MPHSPAARHLGSRWSEGWNSGEGLRVHTDRWLNVERTTRRESDMQSQTNPVTGQGAQSQGTRGQMQFGIFTVGDVTPDPTTGRAPTEHERIKATLQIALKAEEVGLDVFATGEHHNPPF